MAVINKLLKSPTATTFLTRAVSPLRILILTPVVLGTFSKVELDVFFMFGSALVFFTIFSARLGDVFMRMLAYAFAGAESLAPVTELKKMERPVGDSPNWQLFGSAYKTLGSLLAVAALPSVLFAVATFTWTIGTLTDWSFSDRWLWAAAGVGALNSVIEITFLRYRAALVAAGGIAKANLVELFSAVLSVVVSCLVVLLGGGLFGLITTQFVFNCLRRILLIRELPKPLREDRWKFGWDQQIISWAWSPLWKSLVSMTAGMGVERSVGLFLVAVGRPGFAAPFLLAQSLIGTVSQLGSVPLQSQLPRFATMLAKGEGRDVVVQSIARIFPLPIVMFLFVGLGSFLLPWLLELLDSSISFLKPRDWFLLGIGLTLRRFVASFAQVYVLTNNMVFYLRTVIAGVIAVGFFWWGSQTESYTPFALGLWLPTIITMGFYSWRKFIELAGEEKSHYWAEALKAAKKDIKQGIGMFRTPARLNRSVK